MPRGKRTEQDTTMLSMALVGYELEKEKIETKIQELRSMLGGRPVSPSASVAKRTGTNHIVPAAPVDGRKGRTLSPAARKRIAAAQKKRWAEHRKKQAAAE